MSVALSAALAAGCASVPTSGPVREAQRVAAVAGPLVGPDVGDVPPQPEPGDSTDELLDKFLQACADPTDNHAAARRFLTARADAAWHPELHGVAMYDTGSATTTASDDARSRFVVAISQLGLIAPDGGFAFQRAQPAFEFTFAKVDGQWRLDDIPQVLVLSSSQVQRGFKPVQLFFPSRDEATQLVPDLVYLPLLRSALPRGIVARLLDGPTGWVAPAVRTTLPTQTRLDSVTVDAGVATVSLSGAGLSGGANSDMLAQLAWTLTWRDNGAGVTGVQLVINGARQGGVVDASTFAAFDPSGVAPSVAYVLQGSSLRTVGDAGTSSPVDVGADVDSASVDGVRQPWVALLDANSTRLSVRSLADSASGGGQVALPGAGTSPTWGPADTGAWTAVSAGGSTSIVMLARTGQQAGARLVPPAGGLDSVRVLRVSRDGARAAVVSGSGQLFVGIVHRLSGQWVVDGLRAQAPDLAGVQDVAWQDFGTLIALSRPSQAPGPSLYQVSVASPLPAAPVAITGVSGTITGVAAGPTPSILVTTTTPSATALWQTASPAGASGPLAQAPTGQPPLRDPSYPR